MILSRQTKNIENPEISSELNLKLQSINKLMLTLAKEKKQSILKLLEDSRLIKLGSVLAGNTKVQFSEEDFYIFAYPWLLTE